MEALEVKIAVRTKNQVTLPEPIAKQLGVGPGDQLIMSIDENHPGEVRVRPLRRSYAGIAAGIYGTPEEAADYVRRERAAWNE